MKVNIYMWSFDDALGEMLTRYIYLHFTNARYVNLRFANKIIV